MSAQIDASTSPGKFMPVNQPLIYTISDTGSAPDRFVVQTFEDGTEISKVYLTPNNSSKSFFDLSAIVKERVNVDDKIRAETETLLGYKTQAITTGRNGAKKYEVKVGSFSGSTETLNQDNATIYLIDGAQQLSDGLHPSFSDYYATASTKKVWLTDREVDADGIIHVYAREEDEGCFAWIHDSNVISGADTIVDYRIYNGSTLMASANYTITSNGGQALSASDNNQKIHYLLGYPANINGWAASAQKPSTNTGWTHYDIFLESGSATMSRKLRVHNLEGSLKNKNTQLAWTNSVGGWDSVTFTGRTETTDMVKKKPYLSTVGKWGASAYTFLPQARERTEFQVSAETRFKLRRSDFTFEEIRILRYALRSNNVMMRFTECGSGDIWMPVIVDSKSFVVKEAFSGMFTVQMNVTKAQSVKC